MSIRKYRDKTPIIAESAYVDESAVVIGDVKIGEDSSIWPMVVIRGDDQAIVIGDRTNIQDGTVIHVASDNELFPGGIPAIVGDDVVVGHKALLHACTIGNRCLIGMSSTVLDGAVIEDDVILGAGSLVAPGKRLESGYLYVGSPAKRVRKLGDKEKYFLKYAAGHYVELKNEYKTEG
ncbi:MAG: gamma carbonic anhydrase family protein [Gammaproteobacteria bacterium]|jgi:carbonic anhydrase/acetyltransferase-like protein (isoleucine patch superfamily)|nr:gamma carbonic anhydrase family protein [Gammaproteobacteria bacterium]